jgi:hypothetical protein
VLALNATTDGPAAWATRIGVTNGGIAKANRIVPTNKIHLQVAALLRTNTNLEFMAPVIPFLTLWEINNSRLSGAEEYYALDRSGAICRHR